MGDGGNGGRRLIICDQFLPKRPHSAVTIVRVGSMYGDNHPVLHLSYILPKRSREETNIVGRKPGF